MFGFWRKKTCVEGGPHKFEPRYDISMPKNGINAWSWTNKERLDLIEALKEHHYVCDICVHCGQVINARTQVSKTEK